MKHKHAKFIHAWADGEEVQYLHAFVDRDEWVEIGPSHSWSELNEYRVKPKMIKCGEHEFPEPMRIAPEYGTDYWIPAINDSDNTFAVRYNWGNNLMSIRRLKRGLVHATKEAAEAHARALISLTEMKE